MSYPVDSACSRMLVSRAKLCMLALVFGHAFKVAAPFS